MKGFVDDIEKLTEENSDYRRVLYTGKYVQLVLMSLAPGEEIGEEVHKNNDQFFRGEGERRGLDRRQTNQNQRRRRNCGSRRRAAQCD
jgi:hypothetical protein